VHQDGFLLTTPDEYGIYQEIKESFTILRMAGTPVSISARNYARGWKSVYTHWRYQHKKFALVGTEK
jgi:hypothetical protein